MIKNFKQNLVITFVLFLNFLFFTKNSFAQVAVTIKSDTKAQISFNGKTKYILPFTREFRVNSFEEIENLEGHPFTLYIQIGGTEKKIYGRLLIHRETAYTKVSTIELLITKDIVRKVENNEVPIITVRDPSDAENIVLQAIFGNRAMKKNRVSHPTFNKKSRIIVLFFFLGYFVSMLLIK